MIVLFMFYIFFCVCYSCLNNTLLFRMNLCKAYICRPNILGSFTRFSTSTNFESVEPALVEDDEDAATRDADITKKRNVSRLTAAHFNLMNGKRPYEEPKCLAHLTVKYNRKMYGKYGAASGINPSICWPSKQDIADKLEYESVAYPFTIQQMMENVANNRNEEKLKIKIREQDLAAKVAKLEQWKKELKDKVNKKEREAQAAKDKKERLVEEVRRHFGFTLDPRDERFQEMLAKREKEQKKHEKLAKLQAKEKQMIAKLQQKNAELSDKV